MRQFQVLTCLFTASYQFLLQATLPKLAVEGKEQLSLNQSLKTVAINGVLATPLMLVLMTLFQAVSGDLPGLPTTGRTFLAIVTLFSLLAVRRLIQRTNEHALKPACKLFDKVGFLHELRRIKSSYDHYSTTMLRCNNVDNAAS